MSDIFSLQILRYISDLTLKLIKNVKLQVLKSFILFIQVTHHCSYSHAW